MSGLSLWDDVIAAHPVLPWQEQVALAKQRDEGGKRGDDALEKLVLHNLRVVVQHVGRMNAKDSDKHDLFMSGLMGLRKAAERWVPMQKPGFSKPAPFPSYAFLWIREGVTKEAKRIWHDDVSFDAPSGHDDDSSGHETFKDASLGSDEQDHLSLDSTLLDLLTDREKEIVEARLLDVSNESEEELAARLGLSPKSVLPMLHRSIQKLLSAA